MTSELPKSARNLGLNREIGLQVGSEFGVLGRNPVADVLHWRIPKQTAVLPAEL